MTTDIADLTTATDLAFVRAGFYKFLARTFAYPRAGAADVLREELPTAEQAEVLGGDQAVGVREALDAVEKEIRGLTDEGLELSHITTYGHTMPEVYPPHETRYGSSHPFMETQDLADVAAFYEAFGLRVKTGAGERVDHIWLQLEFVHFLAVKQLVALERGETDGATRTLEAAREFVKDHVGRWGPVFGDILSQKAPLPLQRALGALLAAVLRADAHRLGVTPGTVSAEPIPIPPEPRDEEDDDGELDADGDQCGL